MSDTKTSKKLAYLLRHAPEEFDITLADNGWAPLGKVARALNASASDLRRIVENDAKGRYQIDEMSQRIRAVQGHSASVTMSFAPADLSGVKTIFHGTPVRNLDAIFREGLIPGSRQYVHLSRDVRVAHEVGTRRGDAVILGITVPDALAAGVEFFESENGVILCKHVPPEVLSIVYFTETEDDK